MVGVGFGVGVELGLGSVSGSGWGLGSGVCVVMIETEMMRVPDWSHPRVVSWKRSIAESVVVHPQVTGCGLRVRWRGSQWRGC